jgi:CelD/BcsL family acetyltransferase involved in cellulose biosynthesis
MPVEWLDDPRAFIARDWTHLVEADPEATFFHTPRWLKLYWEEFGSDALRIAMVRRGDEDVSAAAFDVRDRTVTWLGGFDLTDYMGPVAAPADRLLAARDLMAALCGLEGWTDADLAGLPEDGAWLGALRDAAGAVGIAATVEPDGVAPFVPLPGSFEEYLAGLPSKLRHEIRRKERRLRERHPGARMVDATPDTAAEAMDRFVEMHGSAVGQKGRFMVPGMELFFHRFAEDLLPDGTLRLSFIEIDGTRIAGALGFRWDDRFLLYNSAFDHAYGDVAPGMVLIAELIRTSIEEHRTGFDMLKGDLSYKYRFGARRRRIMRLRLRREDRS